MRILFVSHYSETLKALRPTIEVCAHRGHACELLNIERVPGDAPRAAEEAHGLPAALSDLPLEPAVELPPRLPPTDAEGIRARRVEIDRRLNEADRVRAVGVLEAGRPDAVVVVNEHMRVYRWLIEEANRRGIRTVFFQWGLGNASVRHSLEMAARLRHGVDFAKHATIEALSERGEEAPAAPRVPAPYWGCGSASIAAVIGQGSAEVFAQLGADPDRARVVGSTVYEPLFERRLELARMSGAERLARRETAGLPTDRPLVLWATNDQRTYWERAHDDETMRLAWLGARDAMLAADERVQILLKPHPKEPIEQYAEVVEGQSRVTAVSDVDARHLLTYCDAAVTRFSTTAFSAMCLGIPAITMNFPPVPGGTLFEDIGGTVHARSPSELTEAVRRALDPGESPQLIARAGAVVDRFVDRGTEPPAVRFCDMLEAEVPSTAAVG